MCSWRACLRVRIDRESIDRGLTYCATTSQAKQVLAESPQTRSIIYCWQFKGGGERGALCTRRREEQRDRRRVKDGTQTDGRKTGERQASEVHVLSLGERFRATELAWFEKFRVYVGGRWRGWNRILNGERVCFKRQETAREKKGALGPALGR